MVARSAATHRLDVLAVVEAQDRKTACREGQIELSLPKGMTLEQVLDPNTFTCLKKPTGGNLASTHVGVFAKVVIFRP